MPNNSYILQGIDVHKSFGLTPALQGANIGVKRGEILAIMGASGSGKSTLLHCLAGIFLPDSGEIWFDGKRLDTLDETKRTLLRRTDFGFVFQFGQLVPELTAEDNIALPLLLNKVDRHDAYEQARLWMSRLGFGQQRVQTVPVELMKPTRYCILAIKGHLSNVRHAHRLVRQQQNLASRLDQRIWCAMIEFLQHFLLLWREIAHVDFTRSGYGCTSWFLGVVFGILQRFPQGFHRFI